MARVGRTTRAIAWSWRAEFSTAAEYRADLISGSLVSSAWMLVALAPFLTVTSHVAIPGWDLPDLIFLVAIWYLLDALIWMILVNSLGTLTEQVKDGSLDTVLMRPVSSLALCTLGKLWVQDLPKVVLAVLVGGYALHLGGGPATVAAGLATAVAVVCSCVLMWAFAVLASFKVLSAVELDSSGVIGVVQNISRLPTTLYGPVAHLVMTVVIPIAFLTTVPAQILFGSISPAWALGAVLVAIGAAALTSRLWYRELHRYTGATG